MALKSQDQLKAEFELEMAIGGALDRLVETLPEEVRDIAGHGDFLRQKAEIEL